MLIPAIAVDAWAADARSEELAALLDAGKARVGAGGSLEPDALVGLWHVEAMVVRMDGPIDAVFSSRTDDWPIDVEHANEIVAVPPDVRSGLFHRVDDRLEFYSADDRDGVHIEMYAVFRLIPDEDPAMAAGRELRRSADHLTDRIAPPDCYELIVRDRDVVDVGGWQFDAPEGMRDGRVGAAGAWLSVTVEDRGRYRDIGEQAVVADLRASVPAAGVERHGRAWRVTSMAADGPALDAFVVERGDLWRIRVNVDAVDRGPACAALARDIVDSAKR